jgi:hypothetical protein
MLPEVKERIRAISIKECETLARSVLEMDSTDDIHAAIMKFHRDANQRQHVPFTAPAEAAAPRSPA